VIVYYKQHDVSILQRKKRTVSALIAYSISLQLKTKTALQTAAGTVSG